MPLRLVICALTLAVLAGCGSGDGDHPPERASNRDSYVLSPERRAEVEREQAAQSARRDPATSARERKALVRDLEASILRDARTRVRKKEMRGPVRRVVCEPTRRGNHVLSCTAVTNELEAADANASNREVTGVTGHPFRAVVDFEAGRYAWCKRILVPGEGGIIDPRAIVPLPKECQP